MRMTMLSGGSCDQVSSRRYNIGAHYRYKSGTSVAGNNLSPTTEVSNVEYQPSAPQTSAFSSFAALDMGDGSGQVDEEEDFGGLMVHFHTDPPALCR